MSHCTSFPIHYADKRTLFRALRKLGWEPENQVWAGFESEIKKKLSFGGKVIGKLLTARTGKVTIFFIETSEGLIPNFESSKMSKQELEMIKKPLINILNKEYVKITVDQLIAEINMSGQSVDLQVEERNESLHFILSIADSSRTVRISMDKEGHIEENVEGIAGKSCLDITQGLESKLSIGKSIERTWTHEYDAVVEDHVIQVLRLSN